MRVLFKKSIIIIILSLSALLIFLINFFNSTEDQYRVEVGYGLFVEDFQWDFIFYDSNYKNNNANKIVQFILNIINTGSENKSIDYSSFRCRYNGKYSNIYNEYNIETIDILKNHNTIIEIYCEVPNDALNISLMFNKYEFNPQ